MNEGSFFEPASMGDGLTEMGGWVPMQGYGANCKDVPPFGTVEGKFHGLVCRDEC